MHLEEKLRATIYSNIYTVRVPRISTYSDFDLDFGIIPENTINGELTKTNHQELTVVGLPIIELARKAEAGFSVSLVNHSDLKTLYEDLEFYIEQRGNESRYMPNFGSGIKEDLILLDAFADSIVSLNDKRALIKQLPTGFLKLKFGKSIPLMNKKPNTEEQDHGEIKRSGYQPPESLSFSDYNKS